MARANAFLTGLLLALALFCPWFYPSSAFAQSPTFSNILVTLAPLNRQTQVELSALTVDANLYEADGRTFAQGTATWKARNTDPANEVTIVVGFPEWASATSAFDPAKFSAFRVLVNNQPVVLTPGVADVIYGDASRDVKW
jgi:hypothetical protein